MKNKILLLFLLIGPIAFAQDPLDEYIQEGLENNLALKQKETSYQKSLAALKEAKGLFFPNVSLNARYSVSQGGRTIDLPIGDLLNPVYATLNQLQQQHAFPEVDNLSFMFLRPQEHETKIRLVQPLFNTDIYYNSIIKKELVNTERISNDQFRLELVAEITKAWYQVAMAESIETMLHEALPLLEENVRVNQKLVDNDKITLDVLYRSKTELIKFNQKIQEGEKNKKMACAYLNFLVNRPLTAVVKIEEPGQLPLIPESTQWYTQAALKNRKELKKLQSMEHIMNSQIKMNRAGALPDLMIVADYGFQGGSYAFNKESDFAQASALLSWTLFSGFQNRAKIRQTILQKEMLEKQTEEVKKQIELQLMNVYYELETSTSGLASAEAQLKSAREGFKLVNRKYENGMASLIEFIDARTSFTEAEELLIISRYQYLSKYADFEKAAAIQNIQ